MPQSHDASGSKWSFCDFFDSLGSRLLCKRLQLLWIWNLLDCAWYIRRSAFCPGNCISFEVPRGYLQSTDCCHKSFVARCAKGTNGPTARLHLLMLQRLVIRAPTSHVRGACSYGIFRLFERISRAAYFVPTNSGRHFGHVAQLMSAKNQIWDCSFDLCCVQILPCIWRSFIRAERRVLSRSRQIAGQTKKHPVRQLNEVLAATEAGWFAWHSKYRLASLTLADHETRLGLELGQLLNEHGLLHEFRMLPTRQRVAKWNLRVRGGWKMLEAFSRLQRLRRRSCTSLTRRPAWTALQRWKAVPHLHAPMCKQRRGSWPP